MATRFIRRWLGLVGYVIDMADEAIDCERDVLEAFERNEPTSVLLGLADRAKSVDAFRHQLSDLCNHADRLAARAIESGAERGDPGEVAVVSRRRDEAIKRYEDAIAGFRERYAKVRERLEGRT